MFLCTLNLPRWDPIGICSLGNLSRWEMRNKITQVSTKLKCNRVWGVSMDFSYSVRESEQDIKSSLIQHYCPQGAERHTLSPRRHRRPQMVRHIPLPVTTNIKILNSSRKVFLHNLPWNKPCKIQTGIPSRLAVEELLSRSSWSNSVRWLHAITVCCMLYKY